MENLLVNKVAAVKEVQQAAEYQKKKQACILTGLAGSSKPVFFAAIDKLAGSKGSMAFITASREEIRAYRRELNYLYPELPMQELYPVSLPRVQADTQSLELQAGRVAALRFLRSAVLSLSQQRRCSKSSCARAVCPVRRCSLL